jgi:hypothetical protein
MRHYSLSVSESDVNGWMPANSESTENLTFGTLIVPNTALAVHFYQMRSAGKTKVQRRAGLKIFTPSLSPARGLTKDSIIVIFSSLIYLVSRNNMSLKN